MEAAVWVKLKCPNKLSSRQIRTALQGCAIANLRSRDDREFILGFSSQLEAARAMALKKVGEVSVCVEEYVPARSSGTISARELSRWSLDELQEELGNTVTKITRLSSNGTVEGSGRFRLDFNSTDLPAEVKLCCGLILPVKQYVPAPLRCRKCLVYRHHENSCTKQKKCNNCGQTGHTRTSCPNPSQCAACSGPHPVTDAACPVFIHERDINREIVAASCTRSEAEKKLPAPTISVVQAPRLALPVSNDLSYATMVSAPPKSAPESAPGTSKPTVISSPSPMDILAANLSALTAILAQISEQNKTIIEQNTQLLNQSSQQLLQSSKIHELLSSGRVTVSPKEVKRKRTAKGQQTLNELMINNSNSSAPPSPAVRVVSLGRDTNSPLAPNFATFDFGEIEQKNK